MIVVHADGKGGKVLGKGSVGLRLPLLQNFDGESFNVGDLSLLVKYATTPDAQQRARVAAQRTLRIADEIQELARLKARISRAPGC